MKPRALLILAAPAAVILLAACTPHAYTTVDSDKHSSASSMGQDASVMATDTTCTITPNMLHDGQTNFAVNNGTGHSLTFSVSENGDSPVGHVDVAAYANTTLTVHLDAGDVYKTMCGKTAGPTLKPGV